MSSHVVDSSIISYEYKLTGFENEILLNLLQGNTIQFPELLEKEHPAPFDVYRRIINHPSYNILTEVEDAILKTLLQGETIQFQELLEKEHPAPFDIYRKTINQDLQTERHLQTAHVTIPIIKPVDLLAPNNPTSVLMITCNVCGSMIDITGKNATLVVRCCRCNETTPIRKAPPGMKYVRCPCNCLLVCKSTAEKILCTRSDCKKILNLAPLPANPSSGTLPADPHSSGLLPEYPSSSGTPGMWQISCAYCHSAFYYTLKIALVRCPYCQKVSSIRPKYTRSWGLLYLITALVLLPVFGLLFTDQTCPEFWPFIFFPFMFILLVLLLFKAIFCFAMKISKIQGPV